MSISLKELRKLVEIEGTPQEIMNLLYSIGYEVESFEVQGNGVTGVVVSEIRNSTIHPKLEKLSVYTIFDGEQEFQVVCGGPVIESGKKVLFARVGARLIGGFEVRRANIQGVWSQGLFCCKDELGLESESEDVFILPGDTQLGLNMVEISGLCDILFKIKTPTCAEIARRLFIERGIPPSEIGV